MRDTGHRDRHGNPLHALTMGELEALPGFHREGGSLRACCPAHGGGNASAFSVNPATGAGTCHRCHAAFVVEDHPEQLARPVRFTVPTIVLGGRRIALPRAPTREDAPQRAPRFKTHQPPRAPACVAPEAARRLAAALARFAAALPGSPGETYLAGRGIPLDAARALGVGWAVDGYFAGRVVFPLAGPDGAITGATGRAIDAAVQPKHKAARKDDGYAKTLVNGAAVARAKAEGGALLVVEGPMDALAVVAGGVPNVVAIGSSAYAWPEHFRGVGHVALMLDGDPAGVKGARAFRDALALEGVAADLSAASALGGHKDAAAFWQATGALPPELLDAAMMPAATSMDLDRKEAAPAGAAGGDGDAFARLRRLVRACPLAPTDLTAVEREEARVFAEDPAYSAEALAADILTAWDTLDPRERTAALYAWTIAARIPWGDCAAADAKAATHAPPTRTSSRGEAHAGY